MSACRDGVSTVQSRDLYNQIDDQTIGARLDLPPSRVSCFAQSQAVHIVESESRRRRVVMIDDV